VSTSATTLQDVASVDDFLNVAATETAPLFEYLEFDFQQSTLEDIRYRDIPADSEGTGSAVEPMDMEMLPSTQVPEDGSLPGTVLGTATSGGARFAVTTLSDATPFGGDDDEVYLAVSPRTPHNRYMLPLIRL
jgi:hypothetical protein